MSNPFKSPTDASTRTTGYVHVTEPATGPAESTTTTSDDWPPIPSELHCLRLNTHALSSAIDDLNRALVPVLPVDEELECNRPTTECHPELDPKGNIQVFLRRENENLEELARMLRSITNQLEL